MCLKRFCVFLLYICGEWGIRTRGSCYRSTVFKTAAIDHSANSPRQKYKYPSNLQTMMLIFYEKLDNNLEQSQKNFLYA